MHFEELGIAAAGLAYLAQERISEATEIQERAIPAILAGKNVLGKAPTGSGKTLAFLLPIVGRLTPGGGSPQVLILAPTRELALQIKKTAEGLAKFYDLQVLALFGGRELAKQSKHIAKGADIVVATPGRLLDHLQSEALDLSQIAFLVIDEADEMLLMGFRPEIDKVMPLIPAKAQVMFFSATLDGAVKKMAYLYMNAPLQIDCQAEEAPLTYLPQDYVLCKEPLKREVLTRLMEEDRSYVALIFCRTKRRTDDLYDYLRSKKYLVEKLHSDIKQSKRERIIADVHKGKIQFLVTTDVAARGLDIEGLTHVYHYDFPESAELYVHRSGRTGRAGGDGRVCLLITQKELPWLDDLAGRLGIVFTERILPPL